MAVEPSPEALQALSARNAELAALNRLAEQAAATPALDLFLARACEEVAALLGCSAVGFYLVDREQREARLLHLLGGTDHDRRRLERTPLDGTVFAPVGVEGATRVRQVDELPKALQELLAPFRLATVASAPARFRGTVVGVLSVGFSTRREVPACRTDLLQAMGAHFASAVQTHRLVGDLRGRVAELTLLNDLAVATTALDPALLLENALRRTSTTFNADCAAAYVLQGVELIQTACLGVAPETAARNARLQLGVGPAGQAAEYGKTMHYPSLGPHDERQACMHEEALQVAVGVPLLAKDRVLGAFVLGRRHPEPFTEPDLTLLSAVGVQLGVAVENARLFADTRRRVSDLEAVNAVAMGVFRTAPGDARALLDETSREMARALGVRSVVVLQLDRQGAQLAGVAGWGTPLPPAELAIQLARSELVRRALATREPVWGLQAFDAPPAGAPVPPTLSLLLLPLTSRGATRGLVALADGPQRRFSEAEVALALALAGEAAVGLENAELYAETRRRVEELSLVNEVGRSLVATLELDQVLDAGVRNLARIVDAPDGYLLLADPSGDHITIRAATGAHRGLLGHAIALRDQASISRLVFETQAPITVEDVVADPRIDPALKQLSGGRAYLGLPLVVRERPIGVALIAETRGPRRFSPAEVERATGIANQLAVAVENARLYEDLRRSYADLGRAQDQLVRQERLAALGELAAVVAHEVRNPLGVIFNSLGALRRLVAPPGADARMLLDIVGEEAERLNRMVGDLLDFARPSRPTLHPEPLLPVVDDAVAAALSGIGRKVTLVREVPDSLPQVPMDSHLLRQAIVNLVVNAAQAMPDGGTLTVRAQVDGAKAVLQLGDTGTGIPDEVRHRIFEPFFTTRATGTGLGLAVVKRIVDDHHGEIEVRPGAGGGTVFELRLPLAPGEPCPVEARRAQPRVKR
jgi:signal transduction histidine kinase/putative methionine-R-sulfoxide reductase with GAF domain